MTRGDANKTIFMSIFHDILLYVLLLSQDTFTDNKQADAMEDK